MWKYWEAGIISCLGCIVLGTVLALTQNNAPPPFVTTAPPISTNLTEPGVALKPIIPIWSPPLNLPQITPAETASPSDFLSQDSILIAANPNSTDSEGLTPDPWDEAWLNDSTDTNWSGYPRQYKADIDPTNYGERVAKDVNGKPVRNPILVVLHETSSSAESAIHTFQTPHPNETDQVSYHALILLDGRIVHLVDSAKRAYGAGDSEFIGPNGVESVQTNPKFSASVNNFAYHISLETPVDGRGELTPTHSGYTPDQYESLAWLVQQLQVDTTRIVTHKEVDRNHQRSDPRSFEMDYLMALLNSYY